MTDQPDTTDRPIATVRRAIALLDVLADAPRDLGTNEIARRTGINASSASRLLSTLAAEEVVHRAADSGRWRLGLRLLQLGNAALARVDLREIARPHLLSLTEATGETATLSLPGGQATMTVDFTQSPSSVRSVAQIGRPSVPHATSIGKVFLGYGGHLPDGPLETYTRHTIADRDALMLEVRQARERGWAEAIGEREEDLNAVAAPVLDAHGELLAILGLQGPSARFDRRAMRAGVHHLHKHARELSTRLIG